MGRGTTGKRDEGRIEKLENNLRNMELGGKQGERGEGGIGWRQMEEKVRFGEEPRVEREGGKEGEFNN